MNKAVAVPVFEDSLRLLDLSATRYTSYPTNEHFAETFSAHDYNQALQLRRTGAATAFPLSIYIHIPFCESLSCDNARNQATSDQHEHATAYLRYLDRELDLHTKQLGVGRVFTQLHVGGGLPAFLSDDQLRNLMGMLRSNFLHASVGDYSIEMDPLSTDRVRLDTLAELGFNRLSFVVHAFSSVVQETVNKRFPVGQVGDLVTAARQRGLGCIHIDFLYGLPQQNLHSFECTLAQVIELRPARITLHDYAYHPDRFTASQRIDLGDLPTGAEKVTMLSCAITALVAAGYVHVGMAHFALPTDALAIAKRQGRLHRNSQGYSTQPDGDLIGLGVSSISRIGATYRQNATTLVEYYGSLDQGRLPVVRGLGLSRDDIVRRAVIMSLMCHGEILYESIELAHLIDFRSYFASEIAALQALEEEGVVTLDNAGIQVSSTGCYFVHLVAMVFDRYLQADRMHARFSRII